MAICKHCGAELSDKVKICPNCGQRNTDYVDESYLDNLLSSVASNEPKREERFSASAKREMTTSKASRQEKNPEAEEVNDDFLIEEEDPELNGYNIFGDLDEREIDQMISKELDSAKSDSFNSMGFEAGDQDTLLPDDTNAEESFLQENEKDSFVMPVQEEPMQENFVQEESVQEETEQEEPTQEEAVQEESTQEEQTNQEEEDEFQFPEEDFFAAQEPDAEEEQNPSEEDFFAIQEPEEPEQPPEQQDEEIASGMDTFSNEDIIALDDLFQDFADNAAEEVTEEDGLQQALLNDMVGITEEGAEKKEKKKEKKSLFKKLFSNVPIDPSKKKPEPTPEEIEAKKQEAAEAKKKSSEEKKAAAAEKKEAAKKAKEEKAKLAQLAKEEKKAKKLEEAKLILEEMEDTRINRLGASVVFIVFGLIAIVIIVGSNLFTYAISIKNAEKSFGMALNNDVRYYTDAYNQIYGLDLKAEDEELGDKIMAVMFVNKQLNSYNNFVAMGDYTSALDSLFKGLLRYNKYSLIASDLRLEVQNDLDYVKSRIMIEMENQYGITRDVADSILAIIDKEEVTYEEALEYTKQLYELAENFRDVK